MCPVCGEDVPFCVGMSELWRRPYFGLARDAETYDAVDLPDEDFNYEEFVKRSGSSGRPAIKTVWWITAILLVAVFIAIYFYAAH